jgi:hypothetical protein
MRILAHVKNFLALIADLKTIKNLIKDRRVMIVGSSPFSDFRRFTPDMTIVNLNGSISRNAPGGVPFPHISFLDFELVDPAINTTKKNRSQIIEKEILKNNNLGYVILTQSNSAKGGDLNLVAKNYKRSLRIGKRLRRFIVMIVSRNLSLEKRRDGKLSTGGFAIACVALCRPQSIYLTGFSLFKSQKSEDPPHSYDENLATDSSSWIDTRSHSLADSLLISSLAIKGIVFLSDDKDLRPLISNWGFK